IMAKQKGLMKYQGTIGDIRHFRIKGKTGYYAGLKGGPTANQIKNAPEFARTRENMSEFGGSAKAAKSLRSAIGPSLSRFADSSLTGRLTALMKGINLNDAAGARGRRSIEISAHKDLLKGLNFNKNLSFNSTFNVPVTIGKNVDGELEFSLPAFLANDYVKAPKLATHFKLVFIVGVVSDYDFNEGTKSYEPKNAEFDGISELFYSDYLPVNGEVPQTEVTGDSELYDNAPNDATLFITSGIEFYHKHNQEYLEVSGG